MCVGVWVCEKMYVRPQESKKERERERVHRSLQATSKAEAIGLTARAYTLDVCRGRGRER